MASSSSLTPQVRRSSVSSDEENSAEPSAKRQKLNLKKCEPCRTARKKCIDVTTVDPRLPVADILVDGAPVLVEGKPLKTCKRCYAGQLRDPQNSDNKCGDRTINARTRGKSEKTKAREAAKANPPALPVDAAVADASLLTGAAAHNAPEPAGFEALLAAAEASTAAPAMAVAQAPDSNAQLVTATHKLQTLSTERKKAQSEIDASREQIGILNGKVMVLGAKIGLLPDQIPTLSAMIGGFSTEIAALNERLGLQKAALGDIEMQEQELLNVVQAGVENLSRAA